MSIKAFWKTIFGTNGTHHKQDHAETDRKFERIEEKTGEIRNQVQKASSAINLKLRSIQAAEEALEATKRGQQS